MSKSHDYAVTENRLAAENSLDDGYWDDVITEHVYYEEDPAPFKHAEGQNGRAVGEFDVLLVNYADQTCMYVEVKTGRDDLSYAEDQLERADDHFDDWDIIGKKHLEQ